METVVLIAIAMILGYAIIQNIVSLIFLPFRLLIKGLFRLAFSQIGIGIIIILLLVGFITHNQEDIELGGIELGPGLEKTKVFMEEQSKKAKVILEGIVEKISNLSETVKDNEDKLQQIDEFKDKINNDKGLEEVKNRLNSSQNSQ